ncbi:M15 family metallopeptidase [Cellulomonas pakistanensis]|uniref:M15 family metallopeptidase n=1 Tax=Cellulomonas pakistanensis TaxID=992287 RepID=UPI001940D626|nr:M15 family metallopeptidase [Cellulomonas pakistanensis]
MPADVSPAHGDRGHAADPGPGAADHRAAHRRPRRASRVAQVASVAVLGGLLAAVALQDAPGGPAPEAAPERPAPAARAEAPEPTARESASGPSSAGGARLDPVPAPAPTGIAAPGRTTPSVPPVDVPATPGTLAPPARVGLDLTLHPTDDPASPWVVVNKVRPLTPADWAPGDLVVVQGYQVRPAVAEPLAQLLTAAAADGVTFPIHSAYRSHAYQQGVHADWAARVGQARADEVSARPGHSEHQTGLAVDLGSSTRPECDFQDCYAETDEGRWLAARAGEFGFVVRYTAENRGVTGYAPEGWHLRWVGTELVAEMERRGVTTLEELFGVPGGATYPG